MGQSLEQYFQQLCRDKQLAVTHQRLVIYRELMQMTDHPNPEQVFARVRPELPSISLATVYKTLHVFLEAGIIRAVSIEPNAMRHHHFICLQCHTITDLSHSEMDVSALENSVPEGFLVEQVSTEVRGLCGRCLASKPSAAHA